MTKIDVETCLNEAYGSIGSRNLRQVVARMSRGPDTQIVRSLMRRFFVKEGTDENYDRCFRFEILDDDEKFVLSISVVAPVYLLLKINAGKITFPKPSGDFSDSCSYLVSIMNEARIQEVEHAILMRKVDVPTYSADESIMYNALFSDVPCSGGVFELLEHL